MVSAAMTRFFRPSQGALATAAAQQRALAQHFLRGIYGVANSTFYYDDGAGGRAFGWVNADAHFRCAFGIAPPVQSIGWDGAVKQEESSSSSSPSYSSATPGSSLEPSIFSWPDSGHPVLEMRTTGVFPN
jgi:hypothetical protein